MDEQNLEEKVGWKEFVRLLPRVPGVLYRNSKRDIARAFKEHPITSTIRTVLIGAGVYGSIAFAQSIQQEERLNDYNNQLTKEISAMADKNNDNATTSKEWAEVYNKLGVACDVHNSDPVQDLSIRQKESYLESRQ